MIALQHSRPSYPAAYVHDDRESPFYQRGTAEGIVVSNATPPQAMRRLVQELFEDTVRYVANMNPRTPTCISPADGPTRSEKRSRVWWEATRHTSNRNKMHS
jgi:hypothetical protein